MEFKEPWRTRIGVVNVKDKIDTDTFLTEMLTNPKFRDGKKSGDSVLSKDKSPYHKKVVDEVVTPAVEHYMREVYGYEFEEDEFTYRSWGVVLTNGKGLEPHFHAGTNISTVLYLTKGQGDLIVMDPRGNACRGMPIEIREANFDLFRHSPQEGDLIIFPSYLLHYVEPGDTTLRVSVPTNYFFVD